MIKKISLYQLLSLMVIHPYATAALYFLTPKLKQDAWIAVLVYIIPGIVLQYIYISLFKKYPNDTLVTYMPKILGKYIGTLVSILYISYFAYVAARDLRDFMELLLNDVVVFMNPYLIIAILMINVMYGVYKGFENIARASGIAFVFVIIGLVLEFILLVTTPHGVKIKFLLPVLEKGITNIITKGWPLITFPYGETIAFTMLFSFADKPSKVAKIAYLSIVIEGILLAIINIMFIISLGPEIASIFLFPHIASMRMIRIGGFINRFDITVVALMIFAAFYKISIFMYASMLGAGQLLKLRDEKVLTVPWGIMIAIISLVIAQNFPQHLKIGLDFTVKYIHLPIQIIIPVCTLIIYYVKNGFKNNKQSI